MSRRLASVFHSGEEFQGFRLKIITLRVSIKIYDAPGITEDKNGTKDDMNDVILSNYYHMQCRSKLTLVWEWKMYSLMSLLTLSKFRGFAHPGPRICLWVDQQVSYKQSDNSLVFFLSFTMFAPSPRITATNININTTTTVIQEVVPHSSNNKLYC